MNNKNTNKELEHNLLSKNEIELFSLFLLM